MTKFVKIGWNGWDTTASLIDDDKELALWLKDGDLEEGDIVFEIKRKLKVVTKGKLELTIEPFGKEKEGSTLEVSK